MPTPADFSSSALSNASDPIFLRYSCAPSSWGLLCSSGHTREGWVVLAEPQKGTVAVCAGAAHLDALVHHVGQERWPVHQGICWVLQSTMKRAARSIAAHCLVAHSRSRCRQVCAHLAGHVIQQIALGFRCAIGSIGLLDNLHERPPVLGIDGLVPAGCAGARGLVRLLFLPLPCTGLNITAMASAC